MEDNLFIFNFDRLTSKRIFNIAIVIIILFVLDFLTGRALRFFYFKESSGYLYRTTYSMDSTEAEILIFGSSRATHHFVPEVLEDSLNMTCYNTGRDGTGIIFQTGVLLSILNRYTPKIIILDYFGSFEKNNVAYNSSTSLLPYYRTHKEIRKIVDLNGSYEKIKLVSEIYPFNSQILSIFMGNLEINKKRHSENKGYVPLFRVWKNEIDTITANGMYEADSSKIYALKYFLDLAKRSGAKVVVIYSPVFQESEINQDTDICSNICALEKVPFWDFSKDTLFLDNRYLFDDLVHLNNNGAMIFSKLVVEKIKKIL